MSLHCRRAVLSLALVSLLALAPVAAGADPSGGGSLDRTETQEQVVPEMQTAPDTDATVTRISVGPDGTAEWQITIRMELASDADREEFAAFEREFEQNRSVYLRQFRDRMTAVVANAATETNREMNASAFEVDIGTQEVPRQWGYVTYRFEWTGFAPVSDGEISVGDVFRGGLFLEAEDILIVDAPADYEVTTTAPEPDTRSDGELQWNGPDSFDDERPQIRLVATDLGGDATPESDGTQGPPANDTSRSFLLRVGVVGAVLVLLVVGTVYTRLRTRTGRADTPSTAESRATGPDAQSTDRTPPDSKSGTTPGPEPEALATDEDRVKSLLRSEDGRVRQADIVDRFGWSASKTSRVLSAMADSGEINKLRIGRENVIELAADGDDS